MLDIQLGQVLTQVVAFLIVYWLLKRWTWKPILGVLHARQAKIEEEFRAIDDQKGKLDQEIETYRKRLDAIDAEAQAKLNQAIDAGKKAAQEIQREAIAKSQGLVKKAEEAIESEIARGKVQLKEEIVNLAVLAAKKLIGENLTVSKQDKLIDDFVAETDFHERT